MLSIVRTQPEGYVVSSTEPIRIGRRFIFLPSNQPGVVVAKISKVSREYLVATEKVFATDRALTEDNWWQVEHPPSSARCVGKLFFPPNSDPNEHCEFRATTARLPTTHSSGSLGWDLWYAPDKQHPWLHLLKGNDLNRPGVCTYTELGSQWPIGIYLFRATLFYKTNLVPLANTQLEYIARSETQQIFLNFNFKFDAVLQ